MSKPIADVVLNILEEHRRSFYAARPYANETGHTVPSDTKSWSQILVSSLTSISGMARKKGRDLADGSDVKAANAWDAIDYPRFNGALPAGRKAQYGDVSALNNYPFLFFVLWDWATHTQGSERCRVWVVRPNTDKVFRKVAAKWYAAKKAGEIKSDNFQLHPPIHREENVVRNECGNLELPLLLRADWRDGKYAITSHKPDTMRTGLCALAQSRPSSSSSRTRSA